MPSFFPDYARSDLLVPRFTSDWEEGDFPGKPLNRRGGLISRRRSRGITHPLPDVPTLEDLGLGDVAPYGPPEDVPPVSGEAPPRTDETPAGTNDLADVFGLVGQIAGPAQQFARVFEGESAPSPEPTAEPPAEGIAAPAETDDLGTLGLTDFSEETSPPDPDEDALEAPALGGIANLGTPFVPTEDMYGLAAGGGVPSPEFDPGTAQPFPLDPDVISGRSGGGVYRPADPVPQSDVTNLATPATPDYPGWPGEGIAAPPQTGDLGELGLPDLVRDPFEDVMESPDLTPRDPFEDVMEAPDLSSGGGLNIGPREVASGLGTLAGIANIGSAVTDENASTGARVAQGLAGAAQAYQGASGLTDALPEIPYLNYAIALLRAAQAGAESGWGGAGSSLLSNAAGAAFGPFSLGFSDNLASWANNLFGVEPTLSHDQREQMGTSRANALAQTMLEELNLATTPEELWAAIERYKRGFDPSIQVHADTLEALLADPSSASVALQAGVDPSRIAEANDALTRILQANATVIKAAQDGNPEAQAFLAERQQQRRDYIARGAAMFTPRDLGELGYDLGPDASEMGRPDPSYLRQFVEPRPTTIDPIIEGLISGGTGSLANVARIATAFPDSERLLEVDPDLFRRYGVNPIREAIWGPESPGGDGDVVRAPNFQTARIDPRDSAAIEAEILRLQQERYRDTGGF